MTISGAQLSIAGCVGHETREPQLAVDRRAWRSDRWPVNIVAARRLDALDQHGFRPPTPSPTRRSSPWSGRLHSLLPW